MKNTILIILILFFLGCIPTPGFSQLFPVYPEKEIGQAEVIVTYMLTFQQDSLHSRKRKERMSLLIGEHKSSFFSESLERFLKASQNFSTAADLQAFVSDPANNVRVGGSRYRIFKNYPEGQITTTDYIPIDYYLVTEDLPLFDWEISGEISNIAGHTVQQATTFFGGREWVAWFAPEIPYNEGPYKFNGLPGLIIKIHDTRKHYLFEMISIEAPAEKTPIHFTERTYIRTTKESYFRAWNSFRDSFSGASDKVPDSRTRHVMGESMRRDNNPIELK